MQWTPLVLIVIPGLPAILKLIKAVVLFTKDFCEAFVTEFKIAYYTEVMHGRGIDYPD